VYVIVIGAGAIGAAVAEELASRGVKVTVLDMRGPGRGASQASAGMLAPYVEAQENPVLLALCVRSLALYDTFIERIRERSGRAIDYTRSGTIEVALTQDNVGRLRDMRAWLDSQHVAAEWLDDKRLRALEPSVSERAIGGLLIPSHGIVGVSSLVQALVQAARAQGVEFESPVEAVRVAESGAGVEVQADERRIFADRVVVAAGSWSRRIRIEGARPLPVKPIRGQLVQLGWSHGQLPSRSLWGAGVYTVPWSPATLLVGATVEDVGFDERSTAAGVQHLLSGVGSLLPNALTGQVADIRVGLRPASADGLPYIGQIAAGSRIAVATGHYRNGILLTPVTATLVANLITSGAADPLLARISPDRELH
jgi:glycine oxidase